LNKEAASYPNVDQVALQAAVHDTHAIGDEMTAKARTASENGVAFEDVVRSELRQHRGKLLLDGTDNATSPISEK
jgi:hypothetical protein